MALSKGDSPDLKYKLIFDNASDMILFVDTRGRILDVNRKVKEVFGYKPAEVIGKDFTKFAIFKPKDLLRLVKFFKDAVRKRKVVRLLELVLKDKKGDDVFVEVSTKALKEGGKLQGFLSIIRDVSDRKKFEELIQKQSKINQDIIEKAPFGIYTVNEKGVVDYANPVMLRISGIQKSKLIGLNMLKLPTYKKIGLADKIKDGLKGKHFRLGPIKYTSYFGKKTTIRNFIGIPLEENGVKELLMIVEDVTEYKKTLDALRESERRFKLVFENSSNLITITDVKAKPLWVNKAWVIKFGPLKKYTKDPLKNAHKDDVGEVVSLWKDLISGKKKRIFVEYRYKMPGGYYNYFSSSAFRLPINGEERYCVIAEDVTVRKKSEDALRASEKRFRDIFNTTTDGLILVNKQLRIVDLNKSVLKLLGFKKSDLIGKNILQLHLKEDYDRCRKNVLSALSGKMCVCDCPYIGLSGKSFVADTVLTQIIINNEKHTLISFRDVTERKEAEKKISDLAKFPSENPDPVLRINKKGVVIYSNKATKELFKKVPKSMISAVKESLVKNTVSELDLLLDSKIFLFVITPIEKEGYANVYGRDITEQSKIEKALRSSEEEYRLIAENTSDFIVVIDLKAKYTFVSHSHRQLGYEPKELIGKSGFDLIHPDDKKRLLPLFFKYAKAGLRALLRLKNKNTVEYLTFRMRNKKGEWFYMESTANLIEKPGGGFEILLVSKDVTERVKKEEELKVLREKEELIKTRKDFLLLVTHELKQPLTPIMGYADLLKEEIVDVDKLKYLDRIINGAQNMYELITKIINLMRLETKQLIFKFQEVELEELINESLTKKASLINLKNIKLKKNINNVTLIVDRNLMREVMLNLLDNAIKFSEDHGVVELTARPKGDNVIISIKDYGIGISEEDLPKIFKTFSQTVEARKRGGFGIGLALAKMIVEKHKGLITVKSKIGEGSTFTVKLPRRRK